MKPSFIGHDVAVATWAFSTFNFIRHNFDGDWDF
jgi:hypothetical protein